MNEPDTFRPERAEGKSAFTLTELLVVVAVITMLAALSLSASLTSKGHVLEAQCLINLRQIGSGWTAYGQEFGQVMPCHWPGVTDTRSLSNPWRTYELYRVQPGTGIITIGSDGPNIPDGPWNLAHLFSTRLVPGPRVFYCPALATINADRAYEYYATPPNTWPSNPGPSDDKVRAGYNYYPQLRTTEIFGGHVVPKAARAGDRWTDLNPKKSIVTDLVNSIPTLAHRASGSVVGLNALFPDGSVIFQSARNNPNAFDVNLWSSPDIIGNNPVSFRYVMSLWKTELNTGNPGGGVFGGGQ